MIVLASLFILCGWLAGIAINHAADILPTRQTLLQWPKCAQCGAKRPVKQWSGLLTWLGSRRECVHCGTPVPRMKRSVLVELVTPILFAFLWWFYGWSLYLGIVTLYTIILILVTVTDLEHRLIFNVIILPSILLAIFASFISPGLTWRAALVGGITAFIVVYIAALLSRGGLGEGDVTLSTFLGFMMGFPNIILSLIFGVFLGGIVAFLLLVSGRVTMKTFIPYGPFLTITGWIMLVWGDEIWRYYFF